MTNDEIQRIAETLYSAIANEVGKGGSAVQVPMIAQAIRGAVVQAIKDHECGDYDGCEFCDKTISEQHTFNVCGPCYNSRIVEARAHAFEEAAKVADGWDMGAPIAKDIRTLKDSLDA